jgi:hypothetical protein
MVHRNRWFTELKNGDFPEFSIAMLVYQRVCQWEFQDPKLEVPIPYIFGLYFRPM